MPRNLEGRLNDFNEHCRRYGWGFVTRSMGNWRIQRLFNEKPLETGVTNYEAALCAVDCATWVSVEMANPRHRRWHGLAFWLLGKLATYFLRHAENGVAPMLSTPSDVAWSAREHLYMAVRQSSWHRALNPQVVNAGDVALRDALDTFNPEVRAQVLYQLGQGMAAVDRLRASLNAAGLLVLPEKDGGES